MKFALFYEIPVAKPFTDGKEHAAYKNTLEQAVLGEQAGFHSFWTVEHHFLEEYSHCSNPEVLYGAIAAKTSTMRLGYGVRLLPKPYNHPIRSAESAAVLDLLSDGRVEFGTGRGSSSAEWSGFAIPSAAETKPMWQEAIEQIPRMWREEYYAYEGKYFRVPRRWITPKPYSKPHPPLWVACSSPPTFTLAGELGLGALCFTTGTAAEVADHVRNYKDAIRRCTKPIGEYVNDHIAVTTNMLCLQDGDEARWLYSRARTGQFLEYLLPVARFGPPAAAAPEGGARADPRADAGRPGGAAPARRQPGRRSRGDRRGDQGV